MKSKSKIPAQAKKSFQQVKYLLENFIEGQNKDALLTEAIKMQTNIFSLEMMKPSLEEIFYNSQGAK